MTTPTDVLDFPQPFGVPMRTTTNDQYLAIDPKHQNYKGPVAKQLRVSVPEGVSIVQAMYSGPQMARLFFTDGSSTREVARISEKQGGGERFAAPVILAAVNDTAYLLLQAGGPPAVGHAGSITVMPYALP